jgi:hypothetical protein
MKSITLTREYMTKYLAFEMAVEKNTAAVEILTT